jgi:tartrate-resistant acid phosphatase type 5
MTNNIIVLASLITGCGLGSKMSPDGPTGADSGSIDRPVSDVDADADTDTDTDTDSDTDTDTGVPFEASLVRFIAMGDGGEGNDDQYATAAAVKTVCDAKADEDGAGCEFALYLGDNFYDVGVTSVDDEQFQTKFELPYADLDFPFYVVLGNHDYGSLTIDFFRASYQVEYSDHSEKWTMPATYYSFEAGDAQFVGLDTNAIMIEDVLGVSAQRSWIGPTLASSEAIWKFAFGHHPYVSNGQHGNAGTYEGIPFIPIVSGETVKDFFDSHICGTVDVYFSGHDHNRQWLEAPGSCGTEFVVSGAAAKTSDLAGRGNPTFFENDTSEGFMWVEVRGRTLIGEFYDKTGTLEYTQTLTK